MRARLHGRQVTLLLTESEIAELDRIADVETISRSAAMRRLVRASARQAAREAKAETTTRESA